MPKFSIGDRVRFVNNCGFRESIPEGWKDMKIVGEYWIGQDLRGYKVSYEGSGRNSWFETKNLELIEPIKVHYRLSLDLHKYV